MIKKIKSSKRGLTFSFPSMGAFKPGAKYRYIIDVSQKQLLIIPSQDGGLVVSRKKSGNQVRALFDMRSREVRELLLQAQYIEVEISETKIQANLISDEGEASARYGKIEPLRKACYAMVEVPRELLKASGGEALYHQYSLFEVFQSMEAMLPQNGESAMRGPCRDLQDVIKVISLFSGAGMLDLPFDRDPNFHIVYAAEYDDSAIATYRMNLGDHIHKVDIRELCKKHLPEADLIIGGPPCQPYSSVNRSGKKGMDHEEGDMLYHYIRLVKETEVKVFALENVPELLGAGKEARLEEIKASLPGYQIESITVKDSDLGGYTERKRALIVGSRIGKAIFPTMRVRPVRTAGDALRKVTPDWANYLDISNSSEQTRKRIHLVPEGGNWKDLPLGLQTCGHFSDMYRRIDRFKPSCTICNWRKYLLSPPKWTQSDEWDRILSVAEAAALSGLDKTFCLLGSLGEKQQQCGNGVPISIGKYLKNVLYGIFARNVELSASV